MKSGSYRLAAFSPYKQGVLGRKRLSPSARRLSYVQAGYGFCENRDPAD